MDTHEEPECPRVWPEMTWLVPKDRPLETRQYKTESLAHLEPAHGTSFVTAID
jgi:hypothetical protein